MPIKQAKSSKSKKKVKRQDRNEKSFTCQGCSTTLDKKNFQYCVCTGVRFCSSDCLQDNPHKDCPGPPEMRIDLNARMKKHIHQNRSAGFTRSGEEYDEMKQTVQIPSTEYLLKKFVSMGINLDNLTAWDYAKLADEGDGLGNQACAYLAASRFKHGILGKHRIDRRGGMVAHNNAADNTIVPVLESQEIAFKYFEKAAKLGHSIAMQSFGECFDEGIGCRSNRRRCNQWLWRSCLHNSAGAISLLNCRALLPLEVRAVIQMMDSVRRQLQPGHMFSSSGPNLGSLLLVFHETVKRENYSLPPFAGTWANGTVNNAPVPINFDKPRIPLIGAEAVKEVMEEKRKLFEINGIGVQFGYGRRGTAKAATVQTRGNDPRAIDNQLFVVPPHASCNECASNEDFEHWHTDINHIYQAFYHEHVLFPSCKHSEKKGQQGGQIHCRECELEAMERLDAVSNGGVVLSINEDLPHHGQAAIFRGKDGALKMETWKNYAGGEAECILAIIAASGVSAHAYASPLFIAQDPNFFWPLIFDHGSIRAALEFVAPHKDWSDLIGLPKHKIVNQAPLLEGSSPGQCLKKCGNSFCTRLEDYKAKGFLSCNQCKRRCYCSTECQRADWSVHKLQCNTNGMSIPFDPHIDAPVDKKNGNNDHCSSLKHTLEFTQGGNVIVHGLASNPKYNGRVGIVGESVGNGRLSLTLMKPQADAASPMKKIVISIKPDNLYHIGVFTRKRRKKSRVFECIHGNETCAECYLDFTTVNRLAKLKYAGQDMTSTFAIDQVNETYFSSCKREFEDGECFTMKEGYPLECYGMETHEKERFILRSLLNVKTDDTDKLSLPAVVAMTAFVTFGATNHLVLRAVTNLERLAQML